MERKIRLKVFGLLNLNIIQKGTEKNSYRIGKMYKYLP